MNTSVAHKHGQHDWHTHSDEEYLEHQRPIDDEKGPLPVIKGHPAQFYDGYHTMYELYDHRRALTAMLAGLGSFENLSWRSKRHHPDDDPMFEGYFIVGIELPTGTVTYHYQLKHWGDFAVVPEIEHAPKWDGATPGDSITRLTGAVAMLVEKSPARDLPA